MIDPLIREHVDYHPCGFGKLCGPAILAKSHAHSDYIYDQASSSYRSPVVVVIVPCNTTARAHVNSWIIKKLGLRAVAWSERTSAGDIPRDVNIVFVCPESIVLDGAEVTPGQTRQARMGVDNSVEFSQHLEWFNSCSRCWCRSARRLLARSLS